MLSVSSVASMAIMQGIVTKTSVSIAVRSDILPKTVSMRMEEKRQPIS